jgi:hypothetical protein
MLLRQKPASGAVFAFQRRRGDRIKLLYWEGQGFCLYYEVLERGRFAWPTPEEQGKAELIWRQTWETGQSADTAIFEVINGFDSPRAVGSRQSAVGWKRPVAFERECGLNKHLGRN